jgi:hypothetical protein
MDVVEGEDMLILINLVRRQLAAEDAGEHIAVVVGLSCVDCHRLDSA